MEAPRSLHTHPPANAHPASAAPGRTTTFRLLGAVLCLGSVATVVVTWRDTWLQRTALIHSQQCPPYPDLVGPAAMILSGPQPDLWLAPAMVALLVMGAQALVGDRLAIPPTLAGLFLVVGASLAYFDVLSGSPTFVWGDTVCAMLPDARLRPAFPLGLLGCVVLSRTTRYRPLNLHDA